jgi:hypothetical protein
MRIHRTITVLDAPDLAVESAFWAALLEGEVEGTDDDWHSIRAGDGSRLAIQLAPDFAPPVWPGEGPRQQPAEDPTAPDRFDVYADPAGHPFCLCVSSGDAGA